MSRQSRIQQRSIVTKAEGDFKYKMDTVIDNYIVEKFQDFYEEILEPYMTDKKSDRITYRRQLQRFKRRKQKFVRRFRRLEKAEQYDEALDNLPD